MGVETISHFPNWRHACWLEMSHLRWLLWGPVRGTSLRGKEQCGGQAARGKKGVRVRTKVAAPSICSSVPPAWGLTQWLYKKMVVALLLMRCISLRGTSTWPQHVRSLTYDRLISIAEYELHTRHRASDLPDRDSFHLPGWEIEDG